VARTVIQKIQTHYDLIGYPRLVRLNPNIPWKTRGNGALCLHIGRSSKTRKKNIGEIEREKIASSLSGKKELDMNESDNLVLLVKETVEELARIDDEKTNPGYVLFSEKPSNEFYWKAVTSIITLDEVKDFLESNDAMYEGYKNGRGLIGATAAVCWEPGDRTFELISYRFRQRWGSKRDVDAFSVQQMDTRFPTTFDNYDLRNHHNRIVPNSPCPILYGIRGDDPEALIEASGQVTSEPVESWVLFETNQGTDDHLQRKSIVDIRPFESVVVEGTVVEHPFTIQGGHVLFILKDETGTIPCAAYEPTKEFRRIIRMLTIGDIVRVYGGVREHPLTINLEKIAVIHLASVLLKKENPICPLCGKHMKSKGTNQGYKCITCSTINAHPRIQQQTRKIEPGFYEVPVCARRHLSKPLKRMLKQPMDDLLSES
jgi:tRNA(Ile2)-agmatinylcytidine synthase